MDAPQSNETEAVLFATLIAIIIALFLGAAHGSTVAIIFGFSIWGLMVLGVMSINFSKLKAIEVKEKEKEEAKTKSRERRTK